MPNSFVFDPNRCTGCGACRLACSIENQLEPERSWRRIDTFNRTRHPGVPLYHLSLACNHCAEPACMFACPALAYTRDDENGAVLLDDDKCTGCRYCAWACPYDAPVFEPPRGVMTKCTFCHHRLREGLKPACASLCPTGALDFADIAETELENSIPGFPATDLGPRVRIEPLDESRRLPVMTAPDVAEPYMAAAEAPTTGVTLRSEWTLMLFTVLGAALVATVAATLASAFSIRPIVFTDAAVVTMALGSFHLGKVSRAYRAILNVRGSWMSREVVAMSSFFVLAAVYLWLGPGNPALGAAAALVGFLGLLSADQVYGVLKASRPAYKHSAGVLWTGLFLTAVFAGSWFAALFGFGKLALYVQRKTEFSDTGRPVRPWTSLARVAFGFAIPVALWLADPAGTRALLVASVMLGELIDRAEYYAELESESPRRQMGIALEELVRAYPTADRRLAASVGD
ncbi:MAG: 4Fe-4S dicluster domain-containing protein [Gemmatimonadetes bacterium]|nr:4Fe-4S dicluster domain-containing protein [Gemmatimonadota bacterium]NIO32012.1 4Fe-4S dicluster domain-containing protein [Gemmatimonadota bacterium]